MVGLRDLYAGGWGGSGGGFPDWGKIAQMAGMDSPTMPDQTDATGPTDFVTMPDRPDATGPADFTTMPDLFGTPSSADFDRLLGQYNDPGGMRARSNTAPPSDVKLAPPAIDGITPPTPIAPEPTPASTPTPTPAATPATAPTPTTGTTAAPQPATPAPAAPSQLPLAPSRLGALVNDNPLDAVAKLHVEYQNGQTGSQMTPEQVAVNAKNMTAPLARVLSQYGAGANAMLDDIARLAWYRQTGGKQGPPESAPKDYIESWKGAYRTGKDVELAQPLDKQLAEVGVEPAGAKQRIDAAMQPQQGTDPKAISATGAAFANLMRLNQNERGQYADEAQWQKWYMAACGAASFAAMVNSAMPDANWNVGKAVDFLSKRGLINTQSGLQRGADFTDIAGALNEAIGAPVSKAVNLKTPGAVQQHFQQGGGAIMVTGPSEAVWGVPHIYVITGATDQGVTIVDSSKANKTTLTWNQYMSQTGIPGAGAGAALVSTSPAAQQRAAATAPNMTAPNEKEGRVPGQLPGYEYPNTGGRSTALDGMPEGPSRLPQGEGFIPAAVPHVRAAAQKTGLPPELILAIAMNENGRNESSLGRDHNNFFGMKADPSWTDRGMPTTDMETREYLNGRWVTVPATWRSYSSPAEGFTGLGDFLRKNRRYGEAGVWDTNDPYEIVQRMYNAGYATDPSWVRQVHSLIRQFQPMFGR